MKRLNHLIILSLLVFLGFNASAFAGHYTFTSNTGVNHIVVIDRAGNPRIGTDPLVTGMEIGVFTPTNLCVGAGFWPATGSLSITVWGDDSQTPAVDGATSGQTLSYRVYDPVGSVEYTSVSVTYSFGPTTYTTGGFSGINSFVGAKKPGKPGFTNPTNSAVGVALSGNLTISAAAGATTHTIQLSTANTFATKLVDQTGNFTTAAYSGLSYNTTYYARALGTNSEGDGDWETISFKTLLSTPTLITPANSAKGLNEGSVSLSWNSVAGATSYNVQYADNPGFNNVTTVNVAATNTTLSGLNNNADYYWMVQAQDGANLSTYSPSRTFKTRVGTTTITNPANNAVGVALSGNLTWTAVAGATSYDVQLIKTPATEVINQNVATNQIPYSNLMNFTDYQIKVTAKNNDGAGNMVTSTFRTILGVPTLATPANNSYNNPLAGNLTWNTVTGATSYDLLVATDAGFSTIVVNQPGIAVTTYAYTGFANNQKYYWKVLAKNAEGTSAYSSSYAFTTLLGTVTLVSPVNNATQVSLSPTLTWNALAGATMYHLQVATNSNFTNLIVDNASLNATSFALSNLNGKTNYYFRVKGKNTNNEGSFSTANMFTTVLSKVILTSPANNAQGLLAASGTLSWQSQSGATGYDLLVSKNSNLSSPVISVNTANATYNYSNLDNNSTYYWAVRSKDNDGDGPYSDTWSFGTQIPAPTLLTPANNATNVVLAGNCTWSAVTGATSYELQIASDAAFSNIVYTASNILSTTGSYENLINNSLHYWRVRAFKNEGAGIWSSAFTFTTMSLPPPVLVYPPNNSIDLFTSADLVWNAALDATGYNVRVASDVGFINVIITKSNVQTLTTNITGLLTNRSYYWQVQTIGSQGVSNWSDAFTFKTYDPNPIVNGFETVCENKEATYTTTVSPLVDYNWAVTGGTIVGSSTGNTVNVAWGNAGQGTIKLTRTSDAWGNYTDNKTLTITKTSVQVVDVTLSANTYFPNKACLNEVVAFNSAINGIGNFTSTWKLNGNVVGTSPTLNYHFTQPGTYTFTYIAASDECEGGQATIALMVDADCPVTIINEDDVYACKNTPTLLSTTIIGGSGMYSLVWSPVTDFLAYQGVPENMKNKVLNPLVKGLTIGKTLSLTVTDLDDNSTYIDLVDIVLNNTPNFSFSPSTVIVQNNNSMDLTDGSIVDINISSGTAPFTYSWVDNNGDPLQDPTDIKLTTPGTYRYFLTVTDANGCPSNSRRLTLIRTNNKEIGDLIVGLSGEGLMMSYPNPVVDELNIYADFGTSQNAKIKVLNLLGQEVFALNVGTAEIYDGSINLSHLSTGSYTLVIETNMNTFAKPFIKQ